MDEAWLVFEWGGRSRLPRKAQQANQRRQWPKKELALKEILRHWSFGNPETLGKRAPWHLHWWKLPVKLDV